MNNSDIVEILPNLWLSSYKYAINEDFLENKKIKVILNCSKNIKFVNNKNITKIRIPVNDSLQLIDIELLYSKLDIITNIIDKYITKFIPVLIHCYAGKQRSATVIAAYIMKITGRPYQEVIALIRSKKSNAFKPEINFIDSLKKYENDLNKNIN
jgi:protein-tyrosine phosphatase